MCKRRNNCERLLPRLQGFRRIFSRFEELDVMLMTFVDFVAFADGLRIV
jgi:hypothetical protein